MKDGSGVSDLCCYDDGYLLRRADSKQVKLTSPKLPPLHSTL